MADFDFQITASYGKSASCPRVNAGVMQKIERYLVDRTLRPIFTIICKLCRIKFRDLFSYCVFISLIIIVPTGLELTATGGLAAQLLLSLLLVGMVAFLALGRSDLKVSSPLWRVFLWAMVAKNLVAFLGRDIHPYSLLMWSFLLISEYVCFVDAIDKEARNE